MPTRLLSLIFGLFCDHRWSFPQTDRTDGRIYHTCTACAKRELYPHSAEVFGKQVRAEQGEQAREVVTA